MRRLKILGVAVLATCAVSGAIASTASADHAGLLLLQEESGTPTFTGSGGSGTLATAAGTTIVCTEASTSGSANAGQGSDITLGTGTIDFHGCKLTKGKTKVACNTEGDEKELLLLSIDWHVFDALNAAGTELEPGIGIEILDPPSKVICGGGTSIVELKGVMLGLIINVSLTTDTETGTLHFVKAGENCDTGSESTYCNSVKSSFLVNFAGTFERAEEETEVRLTFSKMVLVDD